MESAGTTTRGTGRARGLSPVPGYLLGFGLIGLALSAAGPALSHLRDRVGTDDAGIAVVFVSQSLGTIIGSLLAGRGLDAGHGHRRWTLAMLVATGAVVLVGTAEDLPVMAAAFALLGLACGLCDVSGNTLVVWSRPDGAGPLLNALHLSFAVGAMTAPVVVDRSIHVVGSVWGLAVPMGVVTFAAAALMLPHPSPVRTRLDTVARTAEAGTRTLHVAVVCIYFFSYVAMEVGFANWIHSYAEQIGDAAGATGITTMFYVGFMVGRVTAIPASRRWRAGSIVAVTSALAVLAALLFVAVRGPGAELWLVSGLFGLAVAPQYASMMAFAERHLALSGRNAAAVVAASGLGGLTVPWLLGQLFDRVGPEAMPPVVLIMALLTAAVAVAVGALLTGGGVRAAARALPATRRR